MMEVSTMKMERAEARELYEKYQASVSFGTDIDREIARTYRLLGQGEVIIRAIDSIKMAGLGADGHPLLALTRADARRCVWRGYADGSGRFVADGRWRGARNTVSVPVDFFPRATSRWDCEAIVPIVPAHLRPKHSLANYDILWEADWRDVPKDPLLLRRLGKGDLWLVLAAWDLTEVERAALQARV
jgi:hypothetical protein